jgi:hypothetical protein
MFPSLLPNAAAELSRQISEMAPSAALLTTKGFSWLVAAELATQIRSGNPDLGELRANGIDQATAIEFCTAVSERHARVAAAKAAAVAPEPEPVRAVPPSDDDVDAALWQLAELSDAIAKGDACPTNLHWAGYSESTSNELAALIRTSTRRSRT